jgi:hypothetical protein
MINDNKRQMIASTMCMAILIFSAFFGSYAGTDLSQSLVPGPHTANEPVQADPANASNDANDNQRGTEKQPLIVRIAPSPKSPEEAASDQQDREEKTTSDWWIIKLTGILGIVGALQLVTFAVQAHRLKQTVDAMVGQSIDMKSSIVEAARAANAMEGVASAFKVNIDKITESIQINREMSGRQQEFGELQLRAHVGVRIGIATYQDSNLRFATGPVFINTGHTAAKKFRYTSKADILPVPIPQDYKFKLPPLPKASALLPPQEPRDAYTVVDRRVPDDSVDRIKKGIGESLYVWGIASYEDVFGRTKRITFLQQITWIGDKENARVRGFYPNKHNQSN